MTYDGDTNTWAYDTEIGSVNGTNLYNFAENFKTWANHADRDWHPGLTFTYSLSVGEYGVNERIRMTASASDVTWVANATMQTMIDIGATLVGPSVTSSVGLTHALSAQYSFLNWVPLTTETEGSLAAAGSFFPDSFGSLANTPKIEAKLTPLQAYAEGLAIKGATTPRAAVFYDYTSGSYRHCYVADARIRRGRREVYTSTLTAFEVGD